jgi:hypothetical protein
MTPEQAAAEELRTVHEKRGLLIGIIAISLWMSVSWFACGIKPVPVPDVGPAARWAR